MQTPIQTARRAVLEAEREASNLIASTDRMLDLENEMVKCLHAMDRERKKCQRSGRAVNVALETARLAAKETQAA